MQYTYKYKVFYRTDSRKIRSKIVTLKKENPCKKDFGKLGNKVNGFRFERYIEEDAHEKV